MSTKETLETRIDQMGKGIEEIGRNVWLASLGAVGSVDQRSRAVFSDLVARGEKRDAETESTLLEPLKTAGDRIEAFGKKLEQRVEDGVSKTLHRMGAPSRNDVHSLIERVEQLTQKVESLAR